MARRRPRIGVVASDHAAALAGRLARLPAGEALNRRMGAATRRERTA